MAEMWLRITIMLCFTGGSLLAFLVFENYTYEGFAIPCMVSFFLVWYVRRLLRLSREEAQDEEALDRILASQERPLARLARLLERQEALVERQERLLDGQGRGYLPTNSGQDGAS